MSIEDLIGLAVEQGCAVSLTITPTTCTDTTEDA